MARKSNLHFTTARPRTNHTLRGDTLEVVQVVVTDLRARPLGPRLYFRKLSKSINYQTLILSQELQ